MARPSTDAVVQRALDLGFAAAGVATAGPAETMDRFRSWLASGSAAGMSYLARHDALRADPRTLAPGSRSVIAVAARYPANPDPSDGGFSSLAWGEDYHNVLRRRLRELAEWMGRQDQLGTARVCVDSAPLLEREWALRAGIGWRGRQGQVVCPTAGCCVVLGFILVDIELDPTPSVPDRCGDCRLCVEACPTGALQPDGTVDARRCISYWTIEHRGPLPAGIAPLLGGSLFGCDRCTAVCPWNRRGEDLVLPEFRATAPRPDVNACAGIAEQEFERIFNGTAVRRIGAEGLLRNAAAAARHP
jgi:epoxyqueuosine reductase